MVMIEFLKKNSDQSNKMSVDLNAVISILCNDSRIIDWDDADDTLSLLDNSYREDLPLLVKTARDTNATLDARSYSIDAISRIEPNLHSVVSELAPLLQDKEPMIRSDVAEAVVNCDPPDFPIIIPYLARAAKDWHSTVGTQGKAFFALVKLIGYFKALDSLK